MNEIDWSRAPEGADKYNMYNNLFYKDAQPDLQVFTRGQWKHSVFAKGDARFVCRPTTPSWSGEGVPAVGATLETTDKTLNDGAWTKVVILAVGKHGKDDCVLMAEVLDDKGRPGMMVASLYTQYEGCFRPIRTPEQIAADEQETATDVMFARFGGVAGLTRKQCAWVISEGYRKP